MIYFIEHVYNYKLEYDKNTDKEKNIDREEIRILSLVYILCMPNYMLLV